MSPTANDDAAARGCASIGLGYCAAALGALFLVYRLGFTLYILWFATLLTTCCTCGAVSSDELTGGFMGAWSWAGKAFNEYSGSAFLQIVAFPAWNPVSWVALALLIGGILSGVKGFGHLRSGT